MIYNTVCPRNCYSTCSMKVTVEDSRITGIDAHPGNRCTASGVCIKGLSYIQRATAPDRILYPLKRKASGTGFDRISWEDALTEIAERIQQYRKESGPHSIMYYVASGMSGLMNSLGPAFWRMLGGATMVHGNLCWPAGLEATRLTLGENKHNAPWDLENAKLILIWGKNPAETNVQEMVFIQNAIGKGARVIAIDPRRTESAERAEMLFMIRPGTDAALALAIAHVLIQEDLIDHEFINNHVAGFEAFEKHVMSFTPERAAEITHLPAAAIRNLAHMIGTTKPMTMLAGFGMQRYTNGGQTMRALLALQVITGNIGKSGAGWQYANLQSYIFSDLKEPLNYYPMAGASPFRRNVSIARLGEDMLNLRNPALRMLWVERANPMTQNPDTNTVRKAFESIEFRVVVEQFMTDTASMADIILPAKNMFEQSDLTGSYWSPYVQLRQKILEPAGEVKPESEIWYLLAQKAGIPQETILQNLPVPGDAGTEAFLKDKLRPFPELGWEDLKQGPVLPASNQEIAFEDLVFNTPSGKIELFTHEARQRWNANELPDFKELKEIEETDTEDYPLLLLTPCTKNRIHSQFGNLAWMKALEPEPLVHIHPVNAQVRKIKDGDMTELFNQRGSIRVKASITGGIKKGCISLTNGWWAASGGNANFLSKGRETDMGFGTAFHDTMVEIKKADWDI